jgi:hypothetical protein
MKRIAESVENRTKTPPAREQRAREVFGSEANEVLENRRFSDDDGRGPQEAGEA